MKRLFFLILIPLLVISCNEKLPVIDAEPDEINESNYMDYYRLMKKMEGEECPRLPSGTAYTKAMADELNDYFLNRGKTVYPMFNEIYFPDHVKWNYTGKTDQDYITWGTLSGNNWMKFIADNQLVRNMTIPGTHDSYTWTLRDDGIIDEGGCTQGVSDISQFNFGCRYFDIRIDADNGEIQHGSGALACETGIYLNEALGNLIACLKNHPTEGIFIVIKLEAGSSGNMPKTVNDEFEKCRDRWATEATKGQIGNNEFYDIFLPFRSNMTMKELRGHIVVFMRTSLSDETGRQVQYERLRGTNLDLKESLEIGVYNGYDFFGKDFPMISQDYYNVDDMDKKVKQLTYAMKAKSGQYGTTVEQYKDLRSSEIWAFNHASGYSGVVSYNSVAEYVMADTEDRGSWLLRNLRGPFGFLIQDFCGVEKFDPGTFSVERETHGRHFSSFAWQHNFYDDWPSTEQYYVMTEAEGEADWDEHDFQYCTTRTDND